MVLCSAMFNYLALMFSWYDMTWYLWYSMICYDRLASLCLDLFPGEEQPGAIGQRADAWWQRPQMPAALIRLEAWYVNCLLSSEKNSGGSEQSLLNVVLQQHVSCRGCGRMSSRRVKKKKKKKKKWRVSRRFNTSTWFVLFISTHIYRHNVRPGFTHTLPLSHMPPCTKLALSSWYLRNVMFCWLACQYQLGVKGMKRDTLLLGLYAGLIPTLLSDFKVAFCPSKLCQDVPRFVGICWRPARTRRTSNPSLVHI